MNSRDNVIELLTGLEDEARELYKKINAEASPEVANLCRQFAREEEMHSEQIAQEFRQELGEVNWGQLYQELKTLTSNMGNDKPVSQVNELILLALEKEQQALEMYHSLQQLMPAETSVYKLLGDIMEMEKKHQYQILKILHQN